MIEKWKVLFETLANNILVAAFIAIAGILVSRHWRMRPLLPLAAVIVGPIVGFITIEVGGKDYSGLSILFTTIGTLMGPTLVAYLQDPATFKLLLESAKKRLEERRSRKE